MTDLLLLNCTNLPWRPVFPYAFVQVTALARREGLSVETRDLLGVPADRWEELLTATLAETRPRMVGLHIRQGDSVFVDDYVALPSGPPPRPYFPIADNRALVALLRRLTQVPIIAGGFGFTTHAERLYAHLDLDYGVQGCPDDVLAHFDDLAAGRNLGGIASLIHRGGVNPRGYYGPLAEREYTDATVDQLVRFYGHAQLYGADPPTIAVEVMRGCPFRCFFCTEPHVKGSALRYRELDVVEAELDFLVRRRLRRFWLVCSELDIQGTRFALALAERIVRLRERHGGAPIEWAAYALPRLEEDELRLLQRAGYAGALNDVLSLDDANLRAARVPYRSKQAVAFLKAVTKLDREDAAAAAAQAAAAEGKIGAGLVQRMPKELASILGLFLGNAHASPTTIATTLRRIEDEGLRENYRAALAFPSTRVFEPGGVPNCETTPRGLRSYGPTGEREIDALWPTFYYPDFLVERLGSIPAVVEFLRYVADTLMSTGHRARKDWSWFLARHSSPEELAALAPRDVPAPAELLALLTPTAPDRAAASRTAAALLARVFAAHPDAVQRVLAALGLAGEPPSEYRLLEHLYGRYDSRAALDADLAARDALAGPAERLYLEWLLYARNVVLRADYRELLFAR